MPGGFRLILTPRFQRDLEGLPPKDQELVLEALRGLELHPQGPSPKIGKLKGKGVGQWRLKVWPYRVRTDVAGQDVVLERVRHRRDAYRD